MRIEVWVNEGIEVWVNENRSVGEWRKERMKHW